MTALLKYFYNLLTVLLEYINPTMHFPHFLLIFPQQKANYVMSTVKLSMFVVAQGIILKSVLFRSLMQALTMYFIGISQIVIFSKIHVGGGLET